MENLKFELSVGCRVSKESFIQYGKDYSLAVKAVKTTKDSDEKAISMEMTPHQAFHAYTGYGHFKCFDSNGNNYLISRYLSAFRWFLQEIELEKGKVEMIGIRSVTTRSIVAMIEAIKEYVGIMIQESYIEEISWVEKYLGAYHNATEEFNKHIPQPVSVIVDLLRTKCNIELKHSLEEIWKSKEDFGVKRKKMEYLIERFCSTVGEKDVDRSENKSLFRCISDMTFQKIFKDFFKNEEQPKISPTDTSGIEHAASELNPTDIPIYPQEAKNFKYTIDEKTREYAYDVGGEFYLFLRRLENDKYEFAFLDTENYEEVESGTYQNAGDKNIDGIIKDLLGTCCIPEELGVSPLDFEGVSTAVALVGYKF